MEKTTARADPTPHHCWDGVGSLLDPIGLSHFVHRPHEGKQDTSVGLERMYHTLIPQNLEKVRENNKVVIKIKV